jgi:hypothetical protein
MVAGGNRWFTTVDADGNGNLSQQEVIEALKTQLPVDWSLLENKMVPRQWEQFDPDGSGTLLFPNHEMKHPSDPHKSTHPQTTRVLLLIEPFGNGVPFEDFGI